MKKLILLMMRCGYVEYEGFALTKKGRGLLTEKGWQRWNRFLCFIFPSHRKAVIEYLTDVGRRQRLNELVNPNPE